MASAGGHSAPWLGTIRRYLLASAGLHLVWEMLQLPLYTLWSEPVGKQAFAVLHCTAGDLMIASLALLAALLIVGVPDWPARSLGRVWAVLLLLGIGYTVYSEWLNVVVRGSWAYAPLMPRLPVLGTGVSPLLQWVVVPTLALAVAAGAPPWRAQGASG